MVEATAVNDDLERSSVERSSSLDNRSEAGSDASRLRAAGADGLLPDQAAAVPHEDDVLFQFGPDTRSLSLWQRLEEAKKANMASDAELVEMQAAMELMSKGQDNEIAQMQLELRDARIAAAKSLLIQKNQFGREKQSLKRQLEAAEQLGAQAQSEKDIMRVNIRSLQKSISNLKGRTDSSLGEDDKDDPRSRLKPADATHGETLDDVALAQRLRQVEVGDLRMMPAGKLQFAADRGEFGGSASSSSQPLGRQVGSRRRPPRAMSSRTRLDVIEEPDDSDSLDGSSYSGGLNVSSDAGGAGVGDLRDFDEDEVLDLIVDENEHQKEEIRSLREAVEAEKRKFSDLEADVADRGAKIERLTEQLELSSRKRTEIQGELDAARARAPHRSELSEGQPRQHEAADAARGRAQESKIEELTEQLNVLREANRIAETRVEDLKRALRSEEMKHKREVQELTQKLQGSVGNSDHDRNREMLELRERLRSAEQEKNVLVNDFEWKELQWKTQIENAQLELADTKRRSVSEDQSPAAASEASAKGALEARPAPKDSQRAGGETGLVLGWLRCPVRDAGPSRAQKPAFCQEFCWKLVNEISGTVALWCSVNDHIIQQATREANRLWGSAMLEGHSVFSLASGPSSASWLKKAFQSHQRIADTDQKDRGLTGFIVRDLGSESFASRSGDTFDASVITAHFPAEPGCGKPGAVLVILEPQPGPGGSASQPAGLDGSRQPSRPRGAAIQRGQRRGGGPSSEVSASSVSPSDSASNILGLPSAW